MAVYNGAGCSEYVRVVFDRWVWVWVLLCCLVYVGTSLMSCACLIHPFTHRTDIVIRDASGHQRTQLRGHRQPRLHPVLPGHHAAAVLPDLLR